MSLCWFSWMSIIGLHIITSLKSHSDLAATLGMRMGMSLNCMFLKLKVRLQRLNYICPLDLMCRDITSFRPESHLTSKCQNCGLPFGKSALTWVERCEYKGFKCKWSCHIFRYAAKPSSSFESDAVADVLNVFYDSEQSTTGGGTGEINRLNERKTDQSRERSWRIARWRGNLSGSRSWAGWIHRCFKVLI